jgi:hypothetical protein
MLATTSLLTSKIADSAGALDRTCTKHGRGNHFLASSQRLLGVALIQRLFLLKVETILRLGAGTFKCGADAV